MSSEKVRQNIQQLALDHHAKGDKTGWFEVLYQQANGDTSQIPWAKLSPHPILESFLNSTQIESNKTALVIGCGLGDDAEVLSQKGYQVTAFDISPSAIAWCRQRFPNSQVNYQVANLLNLEDNWQAKFDFIFECFTIQSLPLEMRKEVINAISCLLYPNGVLMVITRLRDSEDGPSGPPWPLSEGELQEFENLGLKEIKRIFYQDENNPNIPQVCLFYQ
jgi:2-polyprenyl-3-methyl-5-hydroxy-6-metoxy-1,4-benzoquinol methylase